MRSVAKGSILARRGFAGARRQSLEIGCDRRPILLRKSGGVEHDIGHRRADRIGVRGEPGLEEIGDVLFGPRGDAIGMRRDIRYPAFALGIGAARETALLY